MKKFIFYLLILPFILSACSDDDKIDNDILLKESSITISYGEEYQIEATSATDITYSSENEYYAEVSSTGIITAGKVGETNIILKNEYDTKKLKVVVEPENTLYKEPHMEWGMKRNTFKKKYGEPITESESIITYLTDIKAAPAVMYLFDEDDRLNSASVVVDSQYSNSLGNFLDERYVLVDDEVDENNMLYFVNGYDWKDVTLLIGLQLSDDESVWFVIYVPIEEDQLKSSKLIYKTQFETIYKNIKR